jgi:hypothetical protein
LHVEDEQSDVARAFIQRPAGAVKSELSRRRKALVGRLSGIWDVVHFGADRIRHVYESEKFERPINSEAGSSVQRSQ